MVHHHPPFIGAAFISAYSLLFVAIPCHALDFNQHCIVTTIRPTRAFDDPEHQLIANYTFRVTAYVGKDRYAYCGHGDYCYPANDLKFLTPCRKNEIYEISKTWQ